MAVRACCNTEVLLYIRNVGRLIANRITVGIDANMEDETILKAILIRNVNEIKINTLQATTKVNMKYENDVQLIDIIGSGKVSIKNLIARLEIHSYDEIYLGESYSFHVCCTDNLAITNAILSTTLIARKPNTDIYIDLLLNMLVESTRSVRLGALLVTGPTISVLARNVHVRGHDIVSMAAWDIYSLEAKRITVRSVGDPTLRQTLKRPMGSRP